MKKLNIFAGILSLTMAACSGFLDIAPETSISTSSFFKSQSDFEQAVVGVYAPLKAVYDLDWMMNEMRSDNTHFIFNIGQRGPKQDEDPSTFTVENNNVNTAGKWNANFLIIARANQVLVAIDDADFEETVKKNLKGQTLFLRAFAYFDLLKNFGGVPIFTEPTESYASSFKPRSEPAAVYERITTDLGEAITLLPAKGSQTAGRITSGSAYTLLADVYMNQKNWNEAEKNLKKVTEMGYALLPDYLAVFNPANKGNSEIIFDVQYAEGTSQPLSNYQPYRFLPVLTDPSAITGVSPASPNNDGCYNTPTPDMLAAYEDIAADKRYKASIGFYSGPSPLVGVVYKNTPYIKKYLFPHARYGELGVNWPVYRYAEVLLMLAEVSNELNKPGDARNYLNMVRQRAGLPAISSGGQTDLRSAIFRERRIELAFENKRWHDLVRSGQAVSVMNAYGARVKANPAKYYYPAGSGPAEGSFEVTENDTLYPIPVNEIIINPELNQNPGYF